MVNQVMKLAVGGPVQAKYGTYLSRPADEQLLQACQAGKFAYVLACRQIGKSSLMFATSEKLSKTGVRTAVIDLNAIGLNVEADSWYFSLIDELAHRLELEVNVERWWEERPRLSTPNQRFLQFLREVVLTEISTPIVIFVDEIDMTLGLGFSDDFFAAIRSMHNDRAHYPDLHRLTFVLLGVATPDELIKDHTRTPFNVSQAITLRDFTKEECDPFRLEIETKYPAQALAYFDQIYDWTSGHPYLTQKLCDALLKADALEIEAPASPVDGLVRKLFLAAEARSEDNIQFVQTRVTSDPHAHDMLKIYKRVLAEKSVLDDEQSPPINRLKLYGLVVARNGRLELRNKLYSQAFDLTWIGEMLANVRLGLPNRYKILQQIGQGGFATVYLAELQDASQTQSVALKVLKTPGYNDTTQVKRFKQEARAVARLEHPNIIRILETSGDEEPSFIAMEYIGGGTLRDKLKLGPLPRSEAINIMRQIGAALHYAHSQGIIHRDVNPNNILLDISQEPVRPVLTDFGLVKLLLRDEHSQISSTSIIGTLDYMAPEQWRQETPTPATDQYALAITFYEMLTNRHPFESRSGYYKLMNQHLDEPLPLLSEVMPEIGPFFDAILRRAAAKEPVSRFESIAAFTAALEEANRQAEEVERVALQDQAAKFVEAARSYIQKGRYHADRALAMIEAALETYPGFLDALSLRGKIYAQQEQLEKALPDYQQAFEQNPDLASEIGLEYLKLLNRTAEDYWERRQFAEAVKHYEAIWQLFVSAGQTASNDEVWQKARLRLIEYHHHEANVAYASGHLAQPDEAIPLLQQKIQVLESLEAGNETDDLRDKLKQLRVNQYETMIRVAQGAIEEASAKDTQIRFSNEDIFQHYNALDEAYQALLDLEPGQTHWAESRRKKLKECAEARVMFGIRSLNKLEPDYQAALRHYKAILDLEQSKYPGLAQELHLNLPHKIAELELKADHDGKYSEVMRLIEGKEYLKALERLDQEFVQTGNYEHREVAKWLWGLVYAKHHEGNFPPEWSSMSGFRTLSQRLVEIEQGRIQELRARLDPWSQAKILETIGREHSQLGAYEEQVKDLEISLHEADAHEAVEKRELEVCQNELDAVHRQIQAQREAFFKVNVKETAQIIEMWLQKLDDIEALLQTSNPLKNIPEFLDKIDAEQPAIEKDAALAALDKLVSANCDIGRTINEMKLRIRDRLFWILISDVGWRDEALALSRRDSSKQREELRKAQADLTRTQAELQTTQTEMTQLQQQKEFFKGEFKKTGHEREINRYLIPISLAVAVLAGGVIAPKVGSLLENYTWVANVALAFLIGYFFYYVWVYYLSQWSKK
ncbi:MAG: protein kinase [Anaerolineales bacterium]|nr:protein kinase [Anaerolineales bacterium]